MDQSVFLMPFLLSLFEYSFSHPFSYENPSPHGSIAGSSKSSKGHPFNSFIFSPQIIMENIQYNIFMWEEKSISLLSQYFEKR